MNESSHALIEKSFTFQDCEDSQSLTVSIPEVLDPQYGMYVWPCAVVLSQYVWMAREELQNKTVLELGAGVSLPGVVAAKCGAHVILSDSAELPLCLRNCRRSCDVNNLPDMPVIGLTWGRVSPELLSLPAVDIVLGSDVFYEPEDFEDVLVTISFLVRRNPHAQFWTTYQERRRQRFGHRIFLQMLLDLDHTCNSSKLEKTGNSQALSTATPDLNS
ncbi:Methyltransferase-like protein 23 [Anabarilius grahami]|uniref:Methyltransferase-like protein 23 n=1 Tax=Anabarilius grahami TaxID=495550 RepID=A0A3N0YUA5_ANAGA|nr:Methyltransferase-like protein 23 [Anabarilius grahami]